MSTSFVQIAPGKYAVEVTLTSGNTRRILVRKEQVLNASARGGAYADRWHAYNGGMYLSEFGDTRQEAYDKAVQSLITRNLMEV